MKWFAYFCGIRPILAIFITVCSMAVSIGTGADTAAFLVIYGLIKIVLYIALCKGYYTYRDLGIYPVWLYYVGKATGWVELSPIVILINGNYFAARAYLFADEEYLDKAHDIEGTCVVNGQYGIGEIIAYDDGIVRVEFEKVRVSYMYPEAFKQNILCWGTEGDAKSLAARKQNKETSQTTHEQTVVKTPIDTSCSNLETASCSATNAPKRNTSEKLEILKNMFRAKLKTNFSLDYFDKISELVFDEDYEEVIARIKKPFQYLNAAMNKAQDKKTKVISIQKKKEPKKLRLFQKARNISSVRSCFVPCRCSCYSDCSAYFGCSGYSFDYSDCCYGRFDCDSVPA